MSTHAIRMNPTIPFVNDGYASSSIINKKSRGFATQAFQTKRARGCIRVFGIKPPKALKNYILCSGWPVGFSISATTSTRSYYSLFPLKQLLLILRTKTY
jgi:hypothetical protein